MRRSFGVATLAIIALSLGGWAADHTVSAPPPPTVATISINGIQSGTVAPSAVESFDVGVSGSASAGSATSGAASGRAQSGNFHYTIALDQTAPLLAAAASTGRAFPDATLTIGTAGSIKLSDVRIASVHLVGGPNGVSTEVQLVYAKSEWNMGGKRSGFDAKANKVN
jgi:type VI protein secretion system component Hcp